MELYVSNNNVKGPLPDVFEGGNLKLLYALSQVDRTLTGEQPSSLTCLTCLHSYTVVKGICSICDACKLPGALDAH